MAIAIKDANRVSTLIAALNTDGTTPINVKVDSSTHAVLTLDNTTGSDNGQTRAVFDGDRNTTLIGVSSADGVTPVEVYADSSGNLLINSN